MKTFAHWRAVGEAMRWARKQPGVTFDRTIGDLGIDLRWRADRKYVLVELHNGLTGVTCEFRTGTLFVSIEATGDAKALLNVLAALRMLPREIAETRDERYGRCKKCDEMCIYDDGVGAFEPRWAHVEPIGVWRKHGPHRAEVAA